MFIEFFFFLVKGGSKQRAGQKLSPLIFVEKYLHRLPVSAANKHTIPHFELECHYNF